MNDFHFESVADMLGLGRLSDGEPGMDPDLLRQLYRHARNEDHQRTLFENNSSFPRGWVNLDARRAEELICAFVPLDDIDDIKHARRSAQANLEAQAWNDILGLDSPPIVCKVKIHGLKWGLRFQSAEPALRGREVLNEDLPPIPGGDNSGIDSDSSRPVASVLPAQDQSCSAAVATATADNVTAADVLRKGGLPT